MSVSRFVALALAGVLSAGLVPDAGLAAERPNVLLISVDTLRPDRMSGYGHSRNTSPHIDELLAGGARFLQARTPAPLTAPSMASMWTSLHPHEHGSSRNGLRVRPNLLSFSQILERRGYRTAAFVGNWTLKPELSGLDDFFIEYVALLTRKRWFGMAKREATADDLNEEALGWLDGHLESNGSQPFLLWVHYIEPHAPYQIQEDYTRQIGVKRSGSILAPRKRYDSEIAYVDDRIQEMLEAVYERAGRDNTMVVFVGDHGESLGEHGYWGHGRHVYDVTLWVPMGIVWPERIEPRELAAPATVLDLAPTVLGLIGLEVPRHFQGFDWAPVLDDDASEPVDRVTYHQSHRASVQPKEQLEKLRQKGLLEVARFEGGRKEIYRVGKKRHRVFALDEDRAETNNLVAPDSPPSEELLAWLEEVRKGLALADDLPPPSLSDEDVDALRALGYID